MPSYLLRLSAIEVVHILQAEVRNAHGEPELNFSAEKEYEIEERARQSAPGMPNDERIDLVTSVSTFDIEPRVEQNFWVLETTVMQFLGIMQARDEGGFIRKELTPDEFEAELRSPGRKQVTVRLDAETPFAKEHFDNWLAEMRRKHPLDAEMAAMLAAQEEAEADETDDELLPGGIGPQTAMSWIYGSREAVAAFSDADALEAAVDELERFGFDRAAISVLGAGSGAKADVERFYRTVEEMEDSSETPRQAFVSSDSRTEGEAAAIAVPSYIGGVAGAWAVISGGGALAPAFAVALGAGAVVAGFGALLIGSVARRHRRAIEQQLDRGGLVLWVSVADADAEQRALDILRKSGGSHVHAHEIQRQWGLAEIPFAEAQPDPFLENDR